MKVKFTHPLALVCIIAAAIALAPEAEAAPLSPALDIIAAESEMVMATMRGGEVKFSESDFARATGTESVDSIKITEVPAASDGTLMLGNMAVSAGQQIDGDSLGRLRFVPAGEKSSSFTFTTGGSYEYECVIRMLASANKAPTTKSGKTVEVWTQKDISYYGTLSGYDPDGDKIIYEIVDYPTKGIAVMTDRDHGDFKYTPYAAVTGTDSFSYRVRDEYGNYSDIATVEIEIDKPESDIVFSDMSDHWAENAAIVLAGEGIMNGKTVDGKLCFAPDEKVSRVDFLKMAMDTLGAANVPTVETTVFADNADIPAELRGYVQAAYALGIVKGVREDTGLYFHPNFPVTRSEAAVILNNIIGVDVPASVPVFADGGDVPAWAKGAIYALNSVGIFNSTGSGNISARSELTRAQTANLLLAVMRTVK